MSRLCLVFILSLLVSGVFAAQPQAQNNNFLSNALSDQTPQAFDEGIPQNTQARTRLKPFGANLFAGRFSTRKQTQLDPNYRV
ncbi:MAG: hypothetical protein ACPG51_19440, partial [Thiolinea sp.]